MFSVRLPKTLNASNKCLSALKYSLTDSCVALFWRYETNKGLSASIELMALQGLLLWFCRGECTRLWMELAGFSELVSWYRSLSGVSLSQGDCSSLGGGCEPEAPLLPGLLLFWLERGLLLGLATCYYSWRKRLFMLASWSWQNYLLTVWKCVMFLSRRWLRFKKILLSKIVFLKISFLYISMMVWLWWDNATGYINIH